MAASPLQIQGGAQGAVDLFLEVGVDLGDTLGLGALGLVLNALVLFTTRYLDAAITELRAGGYEVRDEDAARLSPFVRHHINMLGRYSFLARNWPVVCACCATRRSWTRKTRPTEKANHGGCWT